MILADENISDRMVSTLRAKGIKVTSIKEEYRQATDEEVIAHSKALQQIILTKDKDFGEWVFAHKTEKVSVIFLRFNKKDEAVITTLLCKLIEEKGQFLLGKFTTIKVNSIRIREI